MTKQQAKNLFKWAIVIYVIAFFALNWNTVSWVFSYKEDEGLISDFFNPYPTLASNGNGIAFYPNNGLSQQAVTDAEFTSTTEQNSVEIPSLGVDTPLVLPTTTDTNILEQDLDQGAVYYPGSVYPGNIGDAVILGHSSPPGWPNIKHDYIFSNIANLKSGDQILLNFDGKQYTYIVEKTAVVARGTNVSAEATPDENTITLVSCWPPGKDEERIAVFAKLLTK